MPNLQCIIDELKIHYSRSYPKPNFTPYEVALMQEASAQWRASFGNIGFSGRDAIMLSFFRSPEFKRISESPGLIQKIIAAETHLNELHSSIYPRIDSAGISVTFGSILKFGLPMAGSTDYLRLGTENADYGIDISDPNAGIKRLALARDREQRYLENTLPGLQAIAEVLGISAHFEQTQSEPIWKANFGARWHAIKDYLLSLNDIQRGEVINVPNYANTSMIDQAHWWMTGTLGCKDSPNKVAVNTFFREQKQHWDCYSGAIATHYPEYCAIPNQYKTMDALIDHFLNNHLLLDEWFGHMMTDRAHLESLVFAEYPEYLFGDGSHYKMRDIIEAMCIKVQSAPETYPAAAQQLNLRLGRVEDHLAKLYSYNPGVLIRPEQRVEPIVEAIVEQRVKPTAEPIVEQRVEPTAEPIVEQRVEPIAEPMVEQRVEPIAEPIIEQKVEPTAEPIIEQKVEPTAEPIVEQRVEPIAEPIVEQKVEPIPVIEEHPPVSSQPDAPQESDQPINWNNVIKTAMDKILKQVKADYSQFKAAALSEFIDILDDYKTRRELFEGPNPEYKVTFFCLGFGYSKTQKFAAVDALKAALTGERIDLTPHLGALKNGELGQAISKFLQTSALYTKQEIKTVSDLVNNLNHQEDNQLRFK
ncbi:hypothetical protein [Legionella quateirensis]|uniref:Uncharacterized protein n=1 Tax=Legionella quateirensis TaxID=45072 RepID=A0A378KQ92_9GAMM|nr:hypothetical protein [Legionella quateirensis]KTD47865.1 hypothetical protein Lqua_2259 [Legionella quateirensis]STY16763.1 Uncharacterised protein [Legionella quateirensis]